jgi:hypothetical protein
MRVIRIGSYQWLLIAGETSGALSPDEDLEEENALLDPKCESTGETRALEGYADDLGLDLGIGTIDGDDEGVFFLLRLRDRTLRHPCSLGGTISQARQYIRKMARRWGA